MVIAETISGLGALKTALDMTRALKDINDATIRNSVAIDLQEKILSAREAQTALLERISELEKQVAQFEKWDAEKENYQLTAIYADTLAYARKSDAIGAVPLHYICANCYEDRKKRILQRADAAHLMCPDCKIRLRFDSEEAKQFNRPNFRPRSDGWT
ncbi:hypothetical protein IVB45_23000 [Bradyrhizobium sp. 4]|uniref:hypothetical protein n=1 Tax=unclassified Bradyrhizobium TaxID=2631580 RepID=UPI001FF977AE|nr:MULTISPECIES: hypothetical protein [unclassified Bradyrhizobium]MCK1402767.1 hypothetical protein [Bradyrhizobium sp. 39]MCK1748362.1 hypothetical protein [Bradyrhizobium sp. 135]UPJ32835.1 hypothetical protein IVB45_23000 [Bradyrhizobium sp. 4]